VRGATTLPVAGDEVAAVAPLLDEASRAATAGDFSTATRAAAGALRRLEQALETPLHVEPPPRCSAPMVYSAAAKAIVLFGGQSNLVRTDLASHGRNPEPGALNDTWIYEVGTRQWRELPCGRRPPPQRSPLLAYDEVSHLVLLVTIAGAGGGGGKPTATLWSLDLARGEWSRRNAQAWPDDGRGGDDDARAAVNGATLALDPQRRLLLLTGRSSTYVMKVDLDALPVEPAPPYDPPPPLMPHDLPPDDPTWLAKLATLPANQWVHARPPRDADTRDWGTVAADPVRGHVHYFGGGHATYQVNDVAVYAVGANRWARAPGDHNDYVPPVRWDGIAMGFRGGPPAGHQRNGYVACNGRTYVFAGGSSRRWDAAPATQPGSRHAWFYDLDRGGAWRQTPIAKVDLGPGVPGAFGRMHVVGPDGVIYGLAGHLEPYDGRFFAAEAYLSAFDTATATLSVHKIPEPTPAWVGEGRPFCLAPDRGQIFFFECRDEQSPARTWVLDLKTRRFTDLKPARQPPSSPRTVEYLAGQDAVFAIVGRGEQWVYSFPRNAWAPLPLRTDAPLRFAHPYAQAVYVPRHGILVNTGHASGGVAVMRPDARGAEW